MKTTLTKVRHSDYLLTVLIGKYTHNRPIFSSFPLFPFLTFSDHRLYFRKHFNLPFIIRKYRRWNSAPQFPLREQIALQVEPSVGEVGEASDAKGEPKSLADIFVLIIIIIILFLYIHLFCFRVLFYLLEGRRGKEQMYRGKTFRLVWKPFAWLFWCLILARLSMCVSLSRSLHLSI